MSPAALHVKMKLEYVPEQCLVFTQDCFISETLAEFFTAENLGLKEANWYMTAQQVICFHKRLLSILLATHFFL